MTSSTETPWFEVTIPSFDANADVKTLTVQATNWHQALADALRIAGEKSGVGARARCDVLDDGTLRVTEPGSKRVFRLRQGARPIALGAPADERIPQNDPAPQVLQPDMSDAHIQPSPDDADDLDEADAIQARPSGEELRGERVREDGEDTRIGPPRLPFAPIAKMPPLDVQHIWFEVARSRGEWSTLAVVAASPELDTMHVAHALSQMAALDPNSRVLLVNATPKKAADGVTGKVEDIFDDLGGMKRFVDGNYDLIDVTELGQNDAEVGLIYTPQLLDYLTNGDRRRRYTTVVLALGSLLTSATSIPVARSADKVILTVGLERTSFQDARRTIEIVGRERIVGAVSVRPR